MTGVETTERGDIKVYTHRIPYVETSAVAFLVRVGSAHEGDSIAGVSHFLEHVVFRGTKNYSMRDLKYTVESVGGTLNAFTSIKSTVYYARVPSFQLKETVKVLSDMVFHPLIKEEDVEIERKVILEEIRMNDETPEGRLYKMAMMSVWGSPYGRETLGSEETVSKISAEDIKRYHDERYVPRRIRVIVTGKFDLEDLEGISNLDGEDFEDPEEPSFRHNEDVKLETMRDIKHVHVLLMKEGKGKLDEDYEKQMVLDTMLGSGMSSYLFEEIREKLGTVYDISTFPVFLKKTGIYSIYFSTSPENVSKTLDEVLKALKRFKAEDLFDYGLKRRLGKFEMLLESPGGVMNYMVDRLTHSDDVEDPKEYEERMRSITLDEMVDFSKEFLGGKWSVFAVGPEGFSWKVSTVEV